MGVLNNTSDGFANVLYILSNYIIKNGPTEINELLTIFNMGINDNNNSINKTINRWIELDLLSKKDDKICFSKTSLKFFPKIETKNLVSLIRKIIFLEENNKNLLTTKDAMSGDFTTGASWLLTQSLYHEKDYFELMASQIPDSNKRPLSNNTRYNRLKEYMSLLGFASGNGSDYLLDPSQAIEEELPNIFQNKKTLSSKEFIRGLADQIPILDYGKYRIQIEDYLKEEVIKKPDQFQLSETLSFALRRLELKRILEFEDKGDAKNKYKPWNENFFKPFTHVNIL